MKVGDNKKIKIYFDADDTILESSKAVIEILNQKYNISKTIEDLRDWGYKSIYPCSHKEIEEIYESDLFFKKVKFKDGFDKIYNKLKDYFEFGIITKGTKNNIVKKINFVRNKYPEINDWITVDNYTDKNYINMKNCIQIDDRSDCLNSNANLKILIKNNKEYSWNQTPNNINNLYCVNNFEEVFEILNFIIENKEMYF